MGRPAKISSESIVASAVRLVVKNGHSSTTIRSISKDMGVNEAALYRYYKSKEEILWDAYVRIVRTMAVDKEQLAQAPISFQRKLREWIRLTYAFFDEHTDAFTYVLLLPPPTQVGETDITRCQGRIFLALAREAIANGEIRKMTPELVLSHFSGIMLNVPRLIREGILPGPASRYVDEVVEAAWRTLAPTE